MAVTLPLGSVACFPVQQPLTSVWRMWGHRAARPREGALPHPPSRDRLERLASSCHIQILPTHELSGTYLEDVRTVPEFTSKGMKTNAGGYSLFAYTCRILKTDERPSKELYRTKDAGSANSGVCARGYRDAAGRVGCTRALPCSVSGEGLAAAAPEALSTVTAHVLVPNTLLQRREPGLLGEVAESRTRAGNERDEPGTSCSAGK